MQPGTIKEKEKNNINCYNFDLFACIVSDSNIDNTDTKKCEQKNLAVVASTHQSV